MTMLVRPREVTRIEDLAHGRLVEGGVMVKGQQRRVHTITWDEHNAARVIEYIAALEALAASQSVEVVR